MRLRAMLFTLTMLITLACAGFTGGMQAGVPCGGGTINVAISTIPLADAQGNVHREAGDVVTIVATVTNTGAQPVAIEVLHQLYEVNEVATADLQEQGTAFTIIPGHSHDFSEKFKLRCMAPTGTVGKILTIVRPALIGPPRCAGPETPIVVTGQSCVGF
jgi:hypothetical protein